MRLGTLIFVTLFCISNFLFAQQSPQPLYLVKGKTIEKLLAPGDKHNYILALNKGEFAKVVAMQKGIDIVVTVTDPDQKKIKEVDSPNGTSGPEPAFILAETSGAYHFEIKSLDPNAKPGNYTIEIQRIITAAEFNLRNTKNDITISVKPNKVYIVKDQSNQFLNFDFILDNKDYLDITLNTIEVSVFDEENKLAHRDFVNLYSRVSLELNKNVLKAQISKMVYNPFHTFEKSIPLRKLHYTF